MALELKFFKGDDEVTLTAKYEVCPTCDGKGTHVNPAIDGNGLTQEDFDEQGPNFREDYMSGVYDVSCYECKGLRVVLVPDTERNSKEDIEAWVGYQTDLYNDRETQRMEMGYGY